MVNPRDIAGEEEVPLSLLALFVVQVGVITFDSDAHLRLPLQQYDAGDVLAALDNLTYSGRGTTFTSLALTLATSLFLRPAVPKVTCLRQSRGAVNLGEFSKEGQPRR